MRWFVFLLAGVVVVGFGGILWKSENMDAWVRGIEITAQRSEHLLGRQLAADQRRVAPAVFEPPPPSPFASGIWENVTGPWAASRTEKTRAFEDYEGALYVGLWNTEPGNLPLWRFNGEVWDRVPGPWDRTYTSVNVIQSHNEDLYVGTSGETAEVWRFAGGVWADISEDWSAYHIAYSMAEFEGALFVGMAAKDEFGDKNGAVYRLDGEVWEQIGGDGIKGGWSGAGRYIVYELWPHRGRLYAGVSNLLGAAEIWSYDGAWRLEPRTWPLDSHPLVEAFSTYQGVLIASTGKEVPHNQYFPVWALTATWAPVTSTEHALSLGLAAAWNINHLTTFRGRLLAGVGGEPSTAGVWELGGEGVWAQVAGNGISGSWDVLSGAGAEYVYRMQEFRGDLYVGFGYSPGAAQVWRFSPK